MNKSLCIFLLIVAGALAQATPIRWTLGGAVMADGATASGSFVYDADFNLFSMIDVTTAGGSVFAGAHYVGLAPVPGLNIADRLLLVTSEAPIDFYGTPALAIYPTTALSNAGGVVGLLGGARSDSFETTCGALWSPADCDAPGPVRRYLVAGQLTGVQVPEPATFYPAALGLLVTFSIRRLRHVRAANWLRALPHRQPRPAAQAKRFSAVPSKPSSLAL